MTAQIITYPRKPTAAEAHVIRLAERAEHLERERMMTALASAVVTLKDIARLTRKDGERG